MGVVTYAVHTSLVNKTKFTEGTIKSTRKGLTKNKHL